MPFPSDTNPDTEVSDLIAAEVQRQVTGLQLIASENFTSPAVMQAVGSVLTNKYSEGYPGKRYYGGNAVVDSIEALAIERVRRCSMPPRQRAAHSGANADMCAYQAVLQQGDTVLGLSLDHGGHLTHGSPVNQRDVPPLHSVQGDPRRRAHRHGSGARPGAGAPAEDDRGRHHQLSAAPGPRRSRRSPTRWAPCSCSTPRASPASSPVAWPRTRCHADIVTFTTHGTLLGAVAPSCARSSPRRWTRRCSPVGRAARWSTSSPARQWPSSKQHSRASRYPAQVVANASARQALVGQGFRLVSGGTDNHLMVVDLRPFDADLTGKRPRPCWTRAA